MTEKEIKEHLFEQVQEDGYNIIYFEYDVEYDTVYVLKHKRNSMIIWKEIFDVANEYKLYHRDTQLAHFC